MTARLMSLTTVPAHFWDDWSTLNTDCHDAHPLLQTRMVRLLIEHFPADLEVLSIVQDGAPAALLLVKNSAKRSSLSRVGYLPAQSQIALAQLHPDCLNLRQKLLQVLPRTTQRFDLLYVDSVHQARIAAADGAERSTRALDMTINLDGDFESYWETRPKTLRKNISRYRNRVKREIGSFRFNVIREPQIILSAVDRYGFLESKGWKGASGTAVHPNNRQGRFYRALLHEYATTDEAMVFELYHQDRLVASRLTIHNGKMLVILKTTFDEDYKCYAAGRMLLYEVIKHLFAEKKLEHIAFYTSATSEQLQWATDSRPIYNISFYRHPALARVNSLLRNIKRLK